MCGIILKMKLDDIKITRSIVKSFFDDLFSNLEIDCAIVGAGPSGLVASYFLAKAGKKVAIFERKLAVGGGMWGGGMMFNKIVVQKEALPLLEEFGIRYFESEKGYYVADSIEAVSALSYFSVRNGTKIFNLMSAEDVLTEKERVSGLVLNWTPVELNNLHVDPLTIRAKYVVDATGHPAEIASIIQNKLGKKLKTKTGKMVGEKSMDADSAEKSVINNTKEFYPGAFACGMSAIAIFGGHRMGPIFGGMLLSGKKLSEILLKHL